MKSSQKMVWPVMLLLLLLGASLLTIASSGAVYETGDKVWSKNHATALLAEPKPLAATVITVGFAEKFKVKEVQGVWLHIKGDKAEGWVFQGNVASEKPRNAPSVGLTQIAASQTDTVAAARPLAPAAQVYAQRHDASDAQADIDWVDLNSAMISREVMMVWMMDKQLGEYQP